MVAAGAAPAREGRSDDWMSHLLCFDDRAADRTAAGQEFLEFVTLAPADRALQRSQVLVEALQDLEHRFAVVEKDVAPHDRIRHGDPGEVAKSAGREFDDLGFEAVLKIGDGVTASTLS
jgi:hypothetical protein